MKKIFNAVLLVLMFSTGAKAQLGNVFSEANRILKAKKIEAQKKKDQAKNDSVVVFEKKASADTLNKANQIIQTKESVIAKSPVFSAQEMAIYGTLKEKQFQDNIESQFGLGRAVFVGYKRFYGNQVSVYIQSELGYAMDDTKDIPNIDKYYFSKKGAYMGNQKPPRLFVNFTISKEGHIISGKITGDVSDLIGLFLDYWPTSPQWQQASQLKKGVVAQKHFMGDLIRFSFIEAVPSISITKDASLSYNPNQ